MIVFLLLCLYFPLVPANSVNRAMEKGCPQPEDVFPCTCTGLSYNHLQCSNMDDAEALRDIFIRSSRYQYQGVHLENSVLQYLPSDMFQGVRIKELHIVNVTLVQLFDEPPENLPMLDVLHIEKAHVFRGMSWEFLRNFTNLRLLNVYYNRIPVLDHEFSESVTHDLQQLTFYDTQTSLIKPGFLFDFKNLVKIALEHCGLTELKRNIFPKPFNGKYLHFNYNKLTFIPDDLFSDMPNLQTVGLKGNMISTIPRFPSLERIGYLLLEGNPMECDCRIYWLMRLMPEVLTGNCDQPIDRRGYPLKDLDYRQYNCPGFQQVNRLQ